MAAGVGAGFLIAWLMLTREGGVEAAAPPVAGSRETATPGSAAHVLSQPVARTLAADAGHPERRVADVAALIPIRTSAPADSQNTDASPLALHVQRRLAPSTDTQSVPDTPAGPGLLASDGVVVRQTLGAGSEAAQVPVAPPPTGDETTDPVSGMTLRRSVALAEGAQSVAPPRADGTLTTTQSGLPVRTVLPADRSQ